MLNNYARGSLDWKPEFLLNKKKNYASEIDTETADSDIDDIF